MHCCIIIAIYCYVLLSTNTKWETQKRNTIYNGLFFCLLISWHGIVISQCRHRLESAGLLEEVGFGKNLSYEGERARDVISGTGWCRRSKGESERRWDWWHWENEGVSVCVGGHSEEWTGWINSLYFTISVISRIINVRDNSNYRSPKLSCLQYINIKCFLRLFAPCFVIPLISLHVICFLHLHKVSCSSKALDCRVTRQWPCLILYVVHIHGDI